MGLKRMVKNGALGGFGIKRRINFEQMRENTHLIKDITFSALGVGAPKVKPINETFAQCMQRLQLTEADITQRMRSCIQVLFCTLFLGVCIVGYMFYLWHITHYFSLLPCAVLIAVLAAYAFREHFRYFQMKQRRLDCTLGEWFRSTFLGGKGHE